MATPFTKSMISYQQNLLGFLLPLLFTLFVIIRYKVMLNKRILIVIFVTLIFWSYLQYLKQEYFTITMTAFLFYNIITAFVLYKIFGQSLFLLYEKFVVRLSVIAIIGWIMVLIIPVPFKSLISMLGEFKNDGTITSNIFIYSLTNDDKYSEFLFSRNSGFAWEPGRYACILLVALFINLTRHNFRIYKNFNFYILLIALITTQSTTGFMGLLVFIYYYYKNIKEISKKVMLLIPTITLVFLLLNLPFMIQKIGDLWFDGNYIEKFVENLEYDEDGIIVPQRLDGLLFESLNFFNDPLVGYGTDTHDSFVYKKISEGIFLSNGLIKIFSKFGLFLGLAFYFLIYKFSKWHSQQFNYKGKFLYFLVFCIMSSSYSFISDPIFFSFLFFPLASAKKKPLIVSNKLYSNIVK